MMDRDTSHYEPALAYRLSNTEDACIEKWTGSHWIPESYYRNKEEAIISLVYNRSEGAEVSLSDDVISETLRSLKIKAKRIQHHIDVLEAALQL